MYKIFKFDNGLTLYYAKNNINKSTAIDICFDCGSRCDGDIPGLSHFCEHMFFTGTKTENKAEISKQYFDFIRVNAFTNSSEICFTGEIFTKELESYLNMVAKLITQSTFSKKAVEDEKKVVIQEIVKDNDKYNRKASQLFSYLMFEKDYYKNGVLGSVKTVNSIQSKDVKAYVKKYFVSNNCGVYVCSPLSFNKIKTMVSNCLGNKLPQNLKLEKFAFDEYATTDKCKMNLKKANVEKNYLNIAFKIPHDRLTVDNVNTIGMLCDIMQDISDGVPKYLRLQNNLVYYADMYVHNCQKNNVLVFKTECSKENIKSCIDVFCEYVSKLLREGVLKSNIEKQKRHSRYYFETRIYKPTRYLNDLYYSRRYNKIVTQEEGYKSYQKVKLESVNKVLHELFDEPKFVCSVYGDADKSDVYTLNELKNKFNNLI